MDSKDVEDAGAAARGWLASDASPAAFTRGAVTQACERLLGRQVGPKEAMARIGEWERDGLAERVRPGMWLHLGKKPSGALDDLLSVARPGAVASMHTVLGACGAHHNPSVMSFGVLPGPDARELDSLGTKAGRMRFFSLPEQFFSSPDWRVEGSRHPRFKPEKALLDWIWLGQSPACDMPCPNPRDIDLERLDLNRAELWAGDLGMRGELASWLASHPEPNDESTAIVERAKADGHGIKAKLSAKRESKRGAGHAPVRERARARGLAR